MVKKSTTHELRQKQVVVLDNAQTENIFMDAQNKNVQSGTNCRHFNCPFYKKFDSLLHLDETH